MNGTTLCSEIMREYGNAADTEIIQTASCLQYHRKALQSINKNAWHPFKIHCPSKHTKRLALIGPNFLDLQPFIPEMVPVSEIFKNIAK